MHEEKFNYVLESSQSARWLLTEDKLADAMRLKERQYSSCVEKIKDYEKRMAIKRDSSHYEFGVRDESIIVAYYVDDLFKMAASNKYFPKKLYKLIMINTLTVYRRYYLRHSLLDCDAKRLLASSIILGAKLAEVNLPPDLFERILQDFGLKPDVYVKTEMKLLTGCQFDLSVLDHSMVYYSLFAKLASLSKKPVNEEAQADLLAGEVEFYKSDLFFTMCPVLYALATFDTWMEKHHPELQLSDLCGNLSEKTRDELHRAQDRIKKTIEATQAITRQDVQAAAKRFKAFFEALKSANESLPACQADNFKRPDKMLKKRLPDFKQGSIA